MGKLAKRFYEPFQVLERVGHVAYHLKLPEKARIHPVFHCSLLKAFKGSPEHIQEVDLPKQFVQHQPVITPLAILDYRRSSDQAPWEVLVQWEGLSPDDTSWENWDQLFEDYHLEDKVILQGPIQKQEQPIESTKHRYKHRIQRYR